MHIDNLNALRMLSCPDLPRPYYEILKFGLKKMHITVDLSGLQHGLWYVAKRFVEAVGLCYFDSFTLKT